MSGLFLSDHVSPGAADGRSRSTHLRYDELHASDSQDRKTTHGHQGDKANRWRHRYRHWCFEPRDSRYDSARSKRGFR